MKLAGECMRGVIILFLLNMLELWLAAALLSGISWASTGGLVWAANAPGASGHLRLPGRAGLAGEAPDRVAAVPIHGGVAHHLVEAEQPVGFRIDLDHVPQRVARVDEGEIYIGSRS